MRLNYESLKELLEQEVAARNRKDELCYERPDPLLVASRYRDERIALICALFGYGNAKQIVRFLESLDFTLLDASEEQIERELGGVYYRFQDSQDIAALFIALRRLGFENSIEAVVKRGYKKEADIRQGLWELIGELERLSDRESRGYRFLIGQIPKDTNRCAPFKRYMMFFRWMVRRDALDMGLWNGIDRRDLIIPLDTHTHAVSLKLGLLGRKSYDMKAALELTKILRTFDPSDPVKYDFALYRIGQERTL